MKTQAELDAEYTHWLHMVDVAQDIAKRIVESGEMATKTRVEDELMPMFGIDRYDAHMITNYVERHNLRKWGR
jgi:hypothetical protein